MAICSIVFEIDHSGPQMSTSCWCWSTNHGITKVIKNVSSGDQQYKTLLAILLIVVKIFQSGPRWWTGRPHVSNVCPFNSILQGMKSALVKVISLEESSAKNKLLLNFKSAIFQWPTNQIPFTSIISGWRSEISETNIFKPGQIKPKLFAYH